MSHRDYFKPRDVNGNPAVLIRIGDIVTFFDDPGRWIAKPGPDPQSFVFAPYQCKHIPDRPILEFLETLGRWATWYSNAENSVLNVMPLGTPPKVALAKMRRLIERGLVDGCKCGCRGDFELTERGREWLYQARLSI